jgi:hypothetical protein
LKIDEYFENNETVFVLDNENKLENNSKERQEMLRVKLILMYFV